MVDRAACKALTGVRVDATVGLVKGTWSGHAGVADPTHVSEFKR